MSNHLAKVLMDQFAEATGISSNSKPRRYLWTDAYAVCNFLGLAQRTGDERYRSYAKVLVDQVHYVLGRHRDDNHRHGWISGLPDEQAMLHPTRGGLRIGKMHNERGLDDPIDPKREWERDGQYFHYLTKWAHALFRVGRDLGEERYFAWSTELMLTAYNAFTNRTAAGRSRQIFWKMSIDLSRPLVSAMGQHDPLDGLINCLELYTVPEAKSNIIDELARTIDELTEICALANWRTVDPLGIGGLLENATRLAQLVHTHGLARRELLYQIMVAAEISLEEFCMTLDFNRPVEQRLAFRELGLAIGFHGLQRTDKWMAGDAELMTIHKRLMRYTSLAERIDQFWSNPEHRTSKSWNNHLDINAVMLATSLVPDGFYETHDWNEIFPSTL